MSMFPITNGQYDANGNWQRNKMCFAYCGDSCDCGPPSGQWYSAAHDKTKVATQTQPSTDWDNWKPSRDLS